MLEFLQDSEFFQHLLHDVLRTCTKKNVLIVELRHQLGTIFDQNNKLLSIKQEIDIFEHVYKHVKEDHPEFRLRIIITGLKLLGADHIKTAIENIKEGISHSELIAGIDLIHHEDLTTPLLENVPDLMQLKLSIQDPLNVDFFLSSGETHQRNNKNMIDAILLNSKRISHGLSLLQTPTLVEVIKERKSCLEVCPISNMILGHVTDLRNHPVRYMLHKGL